MLIITQCGKCLDVLGKTLSLYREISVSSLLWLHILQSADASYVRVDPNNRGSLGWLDRLAVLPPRFVKTFGTFWPSLCSHSHTLNTKLATLPNHSLTKVHKIYIHLFYYPNSFHHNHNYILYKIHTEHIHLKTPHYASSASSSF